MARPVVVLPQPDSPTRPTVPPRGTEKLTASTAVNDPKRRVRFSTETALSGSLTPREAARLERGQQRLQAKEDRAKADGVVTPRERASLQHAENVQNRRIYAEKHDRQHDYNHDGKVDRPARAHP